MGASTQVSTQLEMGLAFPAQNHNKVYQKLSEAQNYLNEKMLESTCRDIAGAAGVCMMPGVDAPPLIPCCGDCAWDACLFDNSTHFNKR